MSARRSAQPTRAIRSVRFDLYNPPDASTQISDLKGSSNFLTLTGLDTATSQAVTLPSPYSDASSTIQLSAAVNENLDAIAAASDNGSGVFAGPGDNTNALAIAGLETSTSDINGTTFSDYYSSLVGDLGAQAQAYADSQ